MRFLGQSPQALCLETPSQIHREICFNNPIKLRRLTATGGINLSTSISLLIGPCLYPSNKLKALVSIVPVVESVINLHFLRLGVTGASPRE